MVTGLVMGWCLLRQIDPTTSAVANEAAWRWALWQHSRLHIGHKNFEKRLVSERNGAIKCHVESPLRWVYQPAVD